MIPRMNTHTLEKSSPQVVGKLFAGMKLSRCSVLLFGINDSTAGSRLCGLPS